MLKLTICLCLVALPADPVSAQTNTPATNAPVAVPPVAIALADVVTQAQAITAKLADEKAGLNPDPVAKPIEDNLPTITQQIDQRGIEDQQLLAANYSLSSLQNSLAAWQTVADALTTNARDLSSRAGWLDKRNQQLDQLKAAWQATADSAAKAPPEITQRIATVLAAIADAAKALQTAQTEVFSAQSQVAAQAEQVREGQDAIEKIMTAARALLFEKDHAPLWSADALTAQGGPVVRERLSLHAQLSAVKTYLKDKTGAVMVHLLLLALLCAAFYWLRRETCARAAQEPALRYAERVFDVPIATALLLALLASGWLYPLAPRLLWATVGAVALVPAIIIIRRLIKPALLPLLYATMVAYILDQIRYVATPAGVFARFVLLVELLAACIFILIALRSKHLSLFGPSSALLERVIRIYLNWAFFAFLAAGFANVFGYVHLAFFLGNSILESSYLAVIFYAAVRIIDALAITAMSMRPVSGLGMVRRHHDLVYRYVAATIRWVTFAIWAVAAMKIFSVYNPFMHQASEILSRDYKWGSLTFQIGPVLAFPITVGAAFLLSRIIRFTLEEEVFPHLQLGRGIPYAASTMIHYIILVIGFYLAVKAGGADLTQFSFLAGAFGVGLGFGLQNIMNNFISGLILLFERPIKVGDIVQIDPNTIGKVERIGIRASVILLGNGSELIMPNGNLISNPVTNWTLSNCERLVEIPVSVGPKANLERALNLLADAARAHSAVLKNPAPQALLVSLGAAAISLKLRCWIDSEDDWMKVTSELGITLHASLEREDIPLA